MKTALVGVIIGLVLNRIITWLCVMQIRENCVYDPVTKSWHKREL